MQPTPSPAEFARKVERRIQRRSRGRFFTKQHQKLLMRLPFEWFSFVIIILLLTPYLIIVLEGRQVSPGKGSGSGKAKVEQKISPGKGSGKQEIERPPRDTGPRSAPLPPDGSE